MGFLFKFLFGSTLLTLFLAYYLYVPLPKDYTDNRHGYQIILAGNKLVDGVATVGSFLGFGSQLELKKAFGEMILDRLMNLKPLDKSVTMKELSFDGVNVRVYTPLKAEKNGPGIVYYHGGGYALFKASYFDEVCEQMVKMTKAVIVSVDYRTSPEFVYPTAINDGLKATKYFLKHAAHFNVDPSRVAILGDSAGGNMAASLSLQLRDEKFQPMPKLQGLIYPQLQYIDYQTPSHQENNIAVDTTDAVKFFMAFANGTQDSLDLVAKGLHVSSKTREKFQKYVNHDLIPEKYVSKDYKRPSYPKNHETFSEKLEKIATSPYVSPLVAPTLKGIPEVYIMTCQHDCLRDDGVLYVERLKKEGVKYHHVHYDECFHAVFASFAEKYVRETVEFVRDNL